MRTKLVLLTMVVMTFSLLTPSAQVLAQDKPPEKQELIEKPKFLVDFKLLVVELNPENKFGIEWKKSELEETLGSPVEGSFSYNAADDTMTIDSMVMSNFRKFLSYLERRGQVKMLYSQSWSQLLETGIKIDNSADEPYLTRRAEPTGSPEKTGTTLTIVDVVRTGLRLELTLTSVVPKEDGEKVNILGKIELSQPFLKKDTATGAELMGKQLNRFNVDTSIKSGQTLILKSLSGREKKTVEYIGLLTINHLE